MYALDQVRIGVVHLGVGNFHRAHQAVAFEQLLSTGDLRWGICGVGLRRMAMREALAPQQGLYSVLERAGSARRIQVIGALRECLGPADARGPLLARLASAEVSVVTLTITEKGYDQTGPDSAAGVLAAGLWRRRAAGLDGLTAISCDNLPANGRRLREAVLAEADRMASAPGLVAWIEREVAFPASMVDRIVPATTGADRDEAARLLGCHDAWPVPTEAFSQWVIEDRFAGERPALEAAGVEWVPEVAPWEAMKLRLLNAAHSTLAYFGAAAGLRTVDEAIAHPGLRHQVRQLWQEAHVTLPPAVQMQVPRYTGALERRFADPAIGHQLVQIAMDGSRKLGPRLLGTLTDCRLRGLPHQALLDSVAAWMHWVSGADASGAAFPVDDPLLDDFARLRGQPARDRVLALLAHEQIFAPGLARDAVLVEALSGRLARMGAQGALSILTHSADA